MPEKGALRRVYFGIQVGLCVCFVSVIKNIAGRQAHTCPAHFVIVILLFAGAVADTAEPGGREESGIWRGEPRSTVLQR